LDPYPGCLRGALTRFFPRSFGLPQVENGSALGHYPRGDFSAEYISGLQSFTHVQASSLLATQVAPTDAMLLHGGHGVYIRAPYGSLPSHTPDMLAVRIGQLTAGDFHPIGSAALSAAPSTFILMMLNPLLAGLLKKPPYTVLFRISASRQIFCLKILNPHMGLLTEIQLEIEKRSLSRGCSVLAR
jgi:hypothetical protein